jgi:hypothetical protein
VTGSKGSGESLGHFPQSKLLGVHLQLTERNDRAAAASGGAVKNQPPEKVIKKSSDFKGNQRIFGYGVPFPSGKISTSLCNRFFLKRVCFSATTPLVETIGAEYPPGLR